MTIKQKASDGAWKTSVYYFLTNQRGDVSSIIDNTGVEVGSYSYDAYGNVLSETGTIVKENNIRYASYYYDQETKHYYLKARYYDPVNGDFLSLDSHPGTEKIPITQNGYNFANNNPIRFVDPNKRFCCNHWFLLYTWFRTNHTFSNRGAIVLGGITWKAGSWLGKKAHNWLKSKNKKTNVEKVDDKYLKRKKVDAHELKRDALGKKAKIAEYDIYVDKNTKELLIFRKGGKGSPIHTGEYLK
ncbi:RHS repeat-associated core domain-containing protein [Niallia alba]|uniref:RHS repeat-associated core domain-containing protein n=1 Tax=Niallia alba TaxID=2729105 RepID=UPI002E1DB52D|nr:RHS repeat-associated core domain-containing protein [Niallia alba]